LVIWYTVAFENNLSKDDSTYDFKKNEMLITCYKHVDGYIDDVYNVRPNPTDYLGVCGAPFVAEQTDRCNVT